MVAATLARPVLARSPRIRLLLHRAGEQHDTERFWSLAVALQLLEEHLVDLFRRASQAPSTTYARRAWWAYHCWQRVHTAMQAALGR